MWILCCLASVPFLLILVWYYRYYLAQKYLGAIPGPRPLPIIGNALDFTSTSTILPALLRYHRKYRRTYKIFIGFQPVLVISHPRSLQVILSSTKILTKSKQYKFLHNWLRDGLLTATGDKWKKNRKLITPAFHLKILEEFVDVFNSAGEVLVEKISKEVGGGTFDVFPYVRSCALDMICESVMGTSVNAQGNADSPYVRSIEEMGRIMIERGFSIWQQYDFLYQFSSNCKIEKTALEILHGYTRSVITKKVAQNNRQSEKKNLPFLDLLLSHRGDGLTDEELCSEVDTFMFEGHDTTASALGFNLHCLASHPDVQGKVILELKTIFGAEQHRPATFKDLQDMKYLNMVIKEALRVYPAVPFIGRELSQDTEFEGVILPSGLQIFLVPFALHRDPHVYPEPDRFDPDRFLPENVQNRDPFAYVPFSAGPRNCIGQKFAMLEMKAVLSKFLRNYEVQSGQEIGYVSEVVLKAEKGVLVQIKKRNWDR